MKTWKQLKGELLRDKKVAQEYKKLEPQYSVISQMIAIRNKKGITQKVLAARMGTKQSAVARFESGNYNPTLEFLSKTAEALNSKLTIAIQ